MFFLFAKLPDAYAIFDPILDVMPAIPLLFFLLAFVWKAAVCLYVFHEIFTTPSAKLNGVFIPNKKK